METKIINGEEMVLNSTPKGGQEVFVSVMDNEIYNKFTFTKIHPEQGKEDDEDWEPECWVFDGAGMFFHYPAHDDVLMAYSKK